MTKRSTNPAHGGARRRGAILIVALVVLFALAGMTLAMSHAARVDAAASANVAAGIEAEAIVRGAEQWVVQLVVSEQDSALNRPDDDFNARPLGNGWFWVLRPDLDDDSLGPYGLVDEETKVNLNQGSEETIRQLPGATDEITDSILDWRDSDDDVRPNGAESAYYRGLNPPYLAKSDRFDHVEELLMVRGVTREWLYGTGGPGAGVTANDDSDGGNVFNDESIESGVFDRVTVYPDPSFSADIVAVSGNGRAFRRVKMVVNLSGDQPRVLYRRDVTDRGWPLDPAILLALRRGEALPDGSSRMSSAFGSTR